MAEPHPQNVPGPFYVEMGCCISCGVPSEIAPDMFDWEEGDTHCFVSRQPCDPGQVDRMLHAMWAGEVDCIRYRGTDPEIARRIAEFGNQDSCDFPVGAPRVRIRDQVLFRTSAPGDTPMVLAERFRAWLATVEGYDGPRYRVRKPRWWNRQTVKFSWETLGTWFPRLNRVLFFRDNESDWCKANLRSGRIIAGHGLALMVHEWLAETERVSEISWTSHDEREAGVPGFHMPI